METVEILKMLNETLNLVNQINVKGEDVIKMAHVQARLQTIIEELGKTCEVPVHYEKESEG